MLCAVRAAVDSDVTLTFEPASISSFDSVEDSVRQCRQHVNVTGSCLVSPRIRVSSLYIEVYW